MAKLYLRKLKELRPTGPYILGGYCLGGSVALEMAQQLRGSGDEVPLVVFFETYNFSNIKPMSKIDQLHYQLQRIFFHWGNFIALDSAERRRFFQEKAKVAVGRKELWLGMIGSKLKLRWGNSGRQSNLAAIWETNDKAALRYVPKPYSGTVLQFLPMREYAHHRGPGLGWEKGGLIKRLETQFLPVYPAGMLVEPFVRLTAKKLNEYLDLLVNRPSPS
jgi:hypothetical protein